MPKFALNEHAKLLCDLGMLEDMQTPVVKKGTTVKIIGLPGSIPEDYKPWIFEATGRDPESMYKISVAGFVFSDGAWVTEDVLEKLLGTWDELEKITGIDFSKKKEMVT